MTTSNDAHASDEWSGRLSPSDVHHVLFTRAGLGRRGYDEVEVDLFLERVQQELTRLIAEKADLRDEVSRLRSQLAQAASGAPVADGALSKEEANLQAVRLLAAAQQTADVYVADAEKYSQRLTVDAREHSEQLVEEARRAAQQMVAEAERTARDAVSRTIEGETVDAAVPTRDELEKQVAYLRTFGQVVRVQLRAYLEALLRDVEDEWGRADPGVVLREAPATPALRGVTAGGPQQDDRGAVLAPPTGAPAPLPAAVEASVPDPSTSQDDQDVPATEPPDHEPGANGDRPARARKRTVTMHSR